MPEAGGIVIRPPPKLISVSKNSIMSNATHNIKTKIRIHR